MTHTRSVYAIRSSVTRNYCLRRLQIFFDHINYLMKQQYKKEVIPLHKKRQKIQVGLLLPNKILTI
jgi:hypothetical protein